MWTQLQAGVITSFMLWTPLLLPFLQGRTHIFKIHARSMSVERDIRFELLARLCPNSTGELHVFISLLTQLCVCSVSLGSQCWVIPLSQALRSAVSARRQECSRSERAGRSPLRRTSWRQWTKSSNRTRNSALPRATWPTTSTWERSSVLPPKLSVENVVFHVFFLEVRNKWSVPNSRCVFIVFYSSGLLLPYGRDLRLQQHSLSHG